MSKKRSIVLVALVLFSVSLFAAPVVVTWEWMLEDPNVTTFRYQVDGEDPDQWIVVDSSVTSYTVKGLDGSKEYTLYLQQSYDGENFSGSAKAVSEPIFPPEPEVAAAEPAVAEEELVVAPEPAVVEEEMVVAAEPVAAEEEMAEEAEPVAAEEEMVVAEEAEPVVVEEEMAVAEEAEPVVVEEEMAVADAEPVEESAAVEPVVEEKAEAKAPAKKEKAESRFGTTITLGGGFSHRYDAITDSTLAISEKNLKAELGLQLKNMMTFNNTFGLGLDVGIAYTPFKDAAGRSWGSVATDIFGSFGSVMDEFTHAGTLSVAPMLNMQLGKVSADLGGGGFVTYGPKFQSTDSKELMYGAFAKLALGYQFNSWFSMGLDAKYNFVLNDFSNPAQFSEAGIYMGFSF